MTRSRTLLTAAGALLLATASASGAAAQGGQPQYIHLDVSTQDRTTSGHADLNVVHSRNGFHVTGSVTNDRSSAGCVTLKAVEMHLGMDFGGDTVAKVCSKGQNVGVSTQTKHHQVVLQVDESGTVDFESRIVTLTG